MHKLYITTTKIKQSNYYKTKLKMKFLLHRRIYFILILLRLIARK